MLNVEILFVLSFEKLEKKENIFLFRKLTALYFTGPPFRKIKCLLIFQIFLPVKKLHKNHKC